jgi:hypothetical protein
MMESEILTLEQKFRLKVLENHIQGLSQEQVQKLLLKAVQQNMIKDNVIKRCTDRAANSVALVSRLERG